MWLSYLELVNFKSYEHQVFTFPKPENGKNIVLIGGMNGYGKTTILEAIYLGLYGDDAIAHLTRAGIKGNSGYKAFLKKALHGNSADNPRRLMSIKIRISKDEGYSYEFIRRWFFNESGQIDDEDLSIYEWTDSLNKKAINTEQKNEILGNHIIPAHLAPFFFFDGEEAKRLAEQSTEEQLKLGMESLWGVVLIRSLQSDLKNFKSNNLRGVSNINMEHLDKIRDEIVAEEKKIHAIESALLNLSSKITEAQKTQNTLLGKLAIIGGGAGELSTLSDLIEEQSALRQELTRTEAELDKIICDVLPLLFPLQEIKLRFYEQIESEIEYNKKKRQIQNTEKQRDTLLNDLVSTGFPSCKPPLTASQLSAIIDTITTCWNKSFCKSISSFKAIHDYISDGDKQHLLTRIHDINVGAEEVSTLIAEIERIKDNINRIEKQKNRVEGIDKDGRIQKIRDDIDKNADLINALQTEKGSYERELKTLKTNLDEKEKTYSRSERKYLENLPATSLASKAERLCVMIDALILLQSCGHRVKLLSCLRRRYG
jgi:DNA sulfur modification protein DndD